MLEPFWAIYSMQPCHRESGLLSETFRCVFQMCRAPEDPGTGQGEHPQYRKNGTLFRFCLVGLGEATERVRDRAKF